MVNATTDTEPKAKVQSFTSARKKQTAIRIALFAFIAAVMFVLAHRIETLT